MNEAHQMCGSDEWRQAMREVILPWAMGATDLDATALEFGDESFTGAVCFTMLHHVPTRQLQDRLFGEVARVLRPGAALVASDSLGTDELAAHHVDDTYNPVDPESLPDRLTRAGFGTVELRRNDYGWAAVALKA